LEIAEVHRWISKFPEEGYVKGYCGVGFDAHRRDAHPEFNQYIKNYPKLDSLIADREKTMTATIPFDFAHAMAACYSWDEKWKKVITNERPIVAASRAAGEILGELEWLHTLRDTDVPPTPLPPIPDPDPAPDPPNYNMYAILALAVIYVVYAS
jgi:hypothetical protein